MNRSYLESIPITYGHFDRPTTHRVCIHCPRPARVSPRDETLRSIDALVCEAFNLQMHDLIQRTRVVEIVWPRQIAMYLANQMGLALGPTAKRYGLRDHGTALHAVRKVKEIMAAYPEQRALVLDIQSRIAL